MKRIKIMTVVGTRPEIIRLSAVIHKLEHTDMIEHILVHTGQNFDYELSDVFFGELGIRKPDYYLESALPTPVETIGNILLKMESCLNEVLPDAFLVLGDTNSALSAIAARKHHIPIFHMEAGNRCFDENVPEEINRRLVDHISDYNLPYSNISREYLLREGLPPDKIIKTGSPMFEVLAVNEDQIKNSTILEDLFLQRDQYFLVSAHREENISNMKHFKELVNSLNEVAQVYQIPVIFSTHPRTRKQLEHEGIELYPNIRILKPFGFFDYVKLQENAKVVLSDSGTISEESSILGFRALNLREVHERPEAMEETAVVMVGTAKEQVIQGIELVKNQSRGILKIADDYHVPNVSEKVLRIIVSYFWKNT